MAMRTVTRDIGPLEMRAAVVPKSINVDARTVDITWTTGERVLRGYYDQFWEELSLEKKHVRMGRLKAGRAPLLDAHSSWSNDSVIGVVESAELSDKAGTATVRFAKDTRSDAIFQKVADGILGNISVGYRIHKMEKTEDGEGKIPVYRAVDWEPYEISVVPIGADSGGAVRASDQRETNPCVFEERSMSDDGNNPKPSAVDPTDLLVESARKQRDQQRAADNQAAQEAADRAMAAERERGIEIRRIVGRTDLGEALAERFIAANTPIDKVREHVLNHLASRDRETQTDGVLRFEAGDDKSEKFVRGALASILERTGHLETIAKAKTVPRLAKHFSGIATDSGEFGGMRMHDLARYALEMRGRSCKGLHGEILIRKALESRGDQGFNTTSDFAILLETAVNKIFLGSYAMVPVTWPIWCGRKSVQDFRTSTFYRPGTFGVLDSVGEAGEIKHKNIPDGEKRTMTPGTKGNIIGITRRALANDDLGAFQNLAAGLGMAAAFTVEADAFAMVTANSGLGVTYDANPLFHSSRINIGPTGAMSPATLDGARAIMAKQKDPSANQFLALRPAIWLGPVELGGVAKQLNTSTTDPTDNKAQGVSNKVLNLFRETVDSPYLSAQSATRHYLLADPTMFPVFAVGFLDGQEAPRIDSEQSFGYDGVQMKVILDYGVAALDYRGAVTCAGA
jgi:phage head maturation protease